MKKEDKISNEQSGEAQNHENTRNEYHENANLYMNFITERYTISIYYQSIDWKFIPSQETCAWGKPSDQAKEVADTSEIDMGCAHNTYGNRE